MKKYLRSAGYRYTDANDLQDKQFTLLNVEYGFSENTTFSNAVMDKTESYLLFLKNFDSSTFKTKLETIINSAYSDGTNVGVESTMVVENTEAGYNITLTFITRG